MERKRIYLCLAHMSETGLEQKYNPSRLREKVEMMQRHLYRGREVKMQGLSMEEM